MEYYSTSQEIEILKRLNISCASYNKIFFILITCTLVIILLSIFFSYQKSVAVTGAVSSGIIVQKYSVFEPSIITHLAVNERDKVEKGDLLFKLQKLKKKYGSNEYDSVFKVESRIMDESFKSQNNSFNIGLELIDNELEAIELQKNQSIESLKLIKISNSLVKENIQRKELLISLMIKNKEMELFPVNSIRQSESELNDLKIQENKDLLTILELNQNLILFQNKKNKLMLEKKKLIAEHQEVLSQRESDRLKHETDLNISYYAHRSGEIANVNAVAGESLRANETVLSVMEDKEDYSIELFVPPNLIGFIRLNDSVLVEVDTFPYEDYGFLKGTVQHISPSIMSSEDWENRYGIKSPIFKVIVTLKGGEDKLSNNRFKLYEGLTVKAHILTEKMNPWKFLFSPFTEIINKITVNG